MKTNIILLCFTLFIFSCGEKDADNNNSATNYDCNELYPVDTTRGACTETLSHSNEVSFSTSGDLRKITANNIPGHNVGLFGNVIGSINPNAISAQNSSYDIDLTQAKASTKTQLLDNGPTYSFGILLNGIEVDPVAAEPWPHTKPVTNSHNWDWNLEWDNLSDLKGWDSRSTDLYFTTITPSFYLVDDDHKIIGRPNYFSQLTYQVAKLLD